MSAVEPLAHALSVDVEDWFQVLNLAGHVDRADWDKLELRCGDSTKRLLALFDRRGAKATFFVVGKKALAHANSEKAAAPYGRKK